MRRRGLLLTISIYLLTHFILYSVIYNIQVLSVVMGYWPVSPVVVDVAWRNYCGRRLQWRSAPMTARGIASLQQWTDSDVLCVRGYGVVDFRWYTAT